MIRSDDLFPPDKLERYKKALQDILNLRSSFEYEDEWIEAEAFSKSEEIARKALNPGEED